MKNTSIAHMVPDELIMSRIYLIRNQKVMLDYDLAELYQVETKQLKRQVKRHLFRFPEDFMFELTSIELEILRCQIGTSSWGGMRYLPMAFTEQGVAMLSSILNSERAVNVNIQIIRLFTRLRRMLADNTELRLEIEHIKNQLGAQNQNIELVFKYLDELLIQKEEPKERIKIGFKVGV